MVFPNCPGAIGTAERSRIYEEETGHPPRMNERRATQSAMLCDAADRTNPLFGRAAMLHSNAATSITKTL